MPGSVSSASVTAGTVLPLSLSKAFVHTREIPTIVGLYKDGSSDRKFLAEDSRKRWKLSKRLPIDALEALRDFYDARKGSHQPFYFYDPYESNFTYDPTGVTLTGRYTVRFEGGWDQSSEIARSETGIALVQIA